MNVARILKDKGRHVVTVGVDTTLNEITVLLVENKIGAVVVCDTDLHVKGIITERDFVRILAKKGIEALSQPASVHMTKNVHSCTMSDTVDWLMEVMTENRFRHMPVVENNQLVGIVSIGDIVKQRLAIAEMETSSMRDYIATG